MRWRNDTDFRASTRRHCHRVYYSVGREVCIRFDRVAQRECCSTMAYNVVLRRSQIVYGWIMEEEPLWLYRLLSGFRCILDETIILSELKLRRRAISRDINQDVCRTHWSMVGTSIDKRKFTTGGQNWIWRNSVHTHPKRSIFRPVHLSSKKDNISYLARFLGLQEGIFQLVLFL